MRIGRRAFAFGLVSWPSGALAHGSRSKPDDTGKKIAQDAARLGVRPAFLIAFLYFAGQERLGYDLAEQGLHDLCATVNDGRFGRDMQAAALLQQWGIPSSSKGDDGSIDYGPTVIAIMDAISGVKDPYGAEHAAEILGAGPLFGVLRRGGAAMREAQAIAQRNLDSDGS